MTLPELRWVPDRTVIGLDSLVKVGHCQATLSAPFLSALEQEHDTDAHFVTYQVVDLETGHVDPKMPRLNKQVLPEIQKRGGDVRVTMLALDYDTPNHEPWTAAGLDQFMADLAEAYQKGWKRCLEFTAFYTTRSGARFIYVLDEPVPAVSAEALVRCLQHEFTTNGFHVDPLKDWTRLFRMPKVVRDGKRTSEEPGFVLETRPEFRLDPKSLVSPSSLADSAPAPVLGKYRGLPLPEGPEPFLVDRDGKMTQWARQAKRALRGDLSYSIIYEHDKIAAHPDDRMPGDKGRNEQMFRLVGHAVARLYGDVEGTSPERVWALFHSAAEQLNADETDGVTDWVEVLWDHCCRLCSQEATKVREQEIVKAQTEVRARTKTERMLDGMRAWCKDPALHSPDDNEAMAFLLEHCIAGTPTNYYIMTEDGTYDSLGVPMKHIPARIRELGMEDVIPLWVPTKTGARPVKPNEIVDRHATLVHGVYGSPAADGAQIRNLGSDAATLHLRLYRRNPNLKACYHEDVDAWLRHMLGANYDKVTHWIGHALAFEENPICALSLIGPPGCGKKLLVQGLAECLEKPVVADGPQAFGAFRSELLRTPLVNINEGLPAAARGLASDIPSTFRQLVDGSTIVVDIKYRDPLQVTNPCRVVITANNIDVLAGLTGNKDLSPEDRDALAIRLQHYELLEEGSQFLKSQGGVAFTKGWIRGDSGEPSRYIIAEHFMWLYERRGKPSGSRFLVDGEADSEVLRMLVRRAGSAPEVIQALCQMLESRDARWVPHIQDGLIYVSLHTTLTFHQRMIAQETRSRLTQREVVEVFRGLAPTEGPVSQELTIKNKRARYWRIEPRELLSEAIDAGYPCTELEKVVEHRDEYLLNNEVLVAEATSHQHQPTS